MKKPQIQSCSVSGRSVNVWWNFPEINKIQAWVIERTAVVKERIPGRDNVRAEQAFFVDGNASSWIDWHLPFLRCHECGSHLRQSVPSYRVRGIRYDGTKTAWSEWSRATD